MNNYTLPDNIAIIIPVIIAIVIILILIKMNIIKLDCLSCKDDSSESLDCHYKKGEKIENFNNYLSDYPPNQEPSKIYNISKTNIIVEYNTSFDTFDTYEIYTSYTYDGRRDGQGDGKGGGDIINLVDTDINTSWASLNNVYFPDKGYTGSNYLVNDTKGEWIYYKLPKKIRLNSYVISSIYNSPQTWIFYGSNDGKNWIEINDASQKDIVGRNWKEFNDASQIDFNKKKRTTRREYSLEYKKSFTENKNYKDNNYTKKLANLSELYQYFGIVITSIKEDEGDHHAAYVSNIRFNGI